MTGKAAAKWCAQTWMGGWDVPSEVITDSGKEYTSEWWRELCARLGIHHLRCEIHSHRALPSETDGRSLINVLRKELAIEKDFHWLEIIFVFFAVTTTRFCTTSFPQMKLSLGERSVGGTSC